MALCPVWTEKVVKCKEMIWDPATKKSTGERIVPKKKTLICGRKPEVFLRAFYRELIHYRRDEGKHDDLFGLCREHGSAFSGVAAWARSARDHRGSVSGLRGVVERIEVVSPDEVDVAALARQDQAMRTMAAVKSDFKRKMRQRSTERLTVDHWRQLMEECIEEWVTESVMES